MGRFINRDPSEEQGGLNLYAFCRNNGVNAWDYLGMWDEKGNPSNGAEGFELAISRWQHFGANPFIATPNNEAIGFSMQAAQTRAADLARLDYTAARIEAIAAVGRSQLYHGSDGFIHVASSAEDAASIQDYALRWEESTGNIGLVGTGTMIAGVEHVVYRDGRVATGFVAPNNTTAVALNLPSGPSGLPAGWTEDASHRDPNGTRMRHSGGDYLDFHKGRPGEKGWKGRDHWHHNGGDKHFNPGDDVPDPVDPPSEPWWWRLFKQPILLPPIPIIPGPEIVPPPWEKPTFDPTKPDPRLLAGGSQPTDLS